MEFETYLEYAEKCAAKRLDDIISNSSLENATALISTFFSYAENIMRIFTGRLHSKIYEDHQVLTEARSFLQIDQNRKIDILFQEVDQSNLDELANHQFLKICRDFSQQCRLKTVAKIDKNTDAHFVTMDNASFRFCPDKTGTAAFASFNQPKATTNLIEQFNLMFDRGILLTAA